MESNEFENTGSDSPDVRVPAEGTIYDGEVSRHVRFKLFLESLLVKLTDLAQKIEGAYRCHVLGRSPVPKPPWITRIFRVGLDGRTEITHLWGWIECKTI